MRLGYALLVVAVGGAAGSMARYLISVWSIARFGAGFPFGTLVINLSGSFLIGIVFALASRGGMSPYLRVFLATGILGGFTTFSSFAYETYALGAESDYVKAVSYAFGSVAAGVLAAYLGALAGRIGSHA